MDIEKHVANWVYWTYRDLKVKPQWLERDFEKAKLILGIDDGEEYSLIQLHVHDSD